MYRQVFFVFLCQMTFSKFIKFKDLLWHVHCKSIVSFDQNFRISRYNKNLKKKITHIKQVKNIYFT